MQWVTLALSVSVALFLGALLWLAWKLVTRLLATIQDMQTNQQASLKNSEQLTRNLMDRLMSRDLQTYATMTTLANSSTKSNEDEYIDRSDEAEYARLTGMQAAVFPVGSTIFTEADHAENFTTEIGLGDLADLAEKLDDH